MTMADKSRREDIVDKTEDLIAEASGNLRNPMSHDPEETVTVCYMCDDVEGHKPGCPVPVLQDWLKKPWGERG